MALEEKMGKVVLLFDGICNLCNGTVNFILVKDKRNRFRFGAMQSEEGKKILLSYNISPKQIDSVVLIENSIPYFRSSAGLRIFKNLGGGWCLLYGLAVIPIFIRDPIYNWIAANRYKWFGKRAVCSLPDENVKGKFLS